MCLPCRAVESSSSRSEQVLIKSFATYSTHGYGAFRRNSFSFSFSFLLSFDGPCSMKPKRSAWKGQPWRICKVVPSIHQPSILRRPKATLHSAYALRWSGATGAARALPDLWDSRGSIRQTRGYALKLGQCARIAYTGVYGWVQEMVATSSCLALDIDASDGFKYAIGLDH